MAQAVATQGTDSSGKPKTYACRSGMVTSYPGFNFEYGTVQIVVQILADYSMSSPGSCQGSMLIQSVNVWPSILG